MKKVLFITYYWPPSGGSGIQRCLKCVKYLREFGWEPIVFTAENAHYPVLDESLAKDIPEGITVLKCPIWEPYTLYKRLLGKNKEDKVQAAFIDEQKGSSWAKELAVWVRGNLFIPDARRFWIGPATKYLVRYLKNNPVDAIMSSGPPHTTHLIARNVKRQLQIPWLADFRDPWTNIDFYDQLKLTAWADRQHRLKEKTVVEEADQLVTVTWNWGREFEDMGAKEVSVITNGFDPADFTFERRPLDQKFTLSHIGILNKDRDAHRLWEAVSALCQEIPSFQKDLQIQLIGKVDVHTMNKLEKYDLLDNVKRIAYLPHDEVVKWTSASQVLLLFINRTPNVMGLVPGKTFEYLAAHRPILCIGAKKGDAIRIITQAKAGVGIDFDDLAHMKTVLSDYYRAYQSGSLQLQNTEIEQYSRQTLTGKIAAVLDKMLIG